LEKRPFFRGRANRSGGSISIGYRVTSGALGEGGRGVPVPGRRCAAKPTLCMINYNGERFLRESLSAVVAQSDRLAEILLIDNGSQDRSLDIVERDFPSVRIVRLTLNRGPAAARNVALREAGTALALLVDNDVSLAPGCVDELVRALAAHPDAVVAAPAVLYSHDRHRIQYDGADNHFIGLMKLHHQDVPLTGGDLCVREVGSVITACFLVDRKRLPDNQPFDESFFIYFEDHDFGVRMRIFGHQILSVPTAHCFHREGTEGLSIRQMRKYSKGRIYYLIRNRWLFIFKNYSIRTLLILSPILIFYETAQFFVITKKGWLREWAKAVVWVVGHAPELLELRRRIQRCRKNPDRLLLLGGPLPFREELTAGRFERFGRRFLDAVVGSYWKMVAQLI
jgi:GT2 family glycosyltransferase